MPNIPPIDLTERPPRSPRARLGGYAILPRVLDKGRAAVLGTNGEYKYACPLDEHFLLFAGVDAAKLKAQLAKGKGDGDVLAWINANSTTQPSAPEIEAWSAYHDRRTPGDVESRAYFSKLHAEIAPAREDIQTWFDLLDVDDHVTFGGQP